MKLLNMDEVLGKVTDFIKNEVKTEAIIGQPFKLGEFDCVPVIRVGIGFGSGEMEGEAPKTGHGDLGGAGAGLGMEPLGFLVSRGEEITFVNTKLNKGITAAFEKVPELIERYMESRVQEKDAVPA
ncbi:MAG: GerW family sporulation protein [Lewinellaceae bacterium]|nr:GerW family sporulation protein [Lewinellaceae bacterium]